MLLVSTNKEYIKIYAVILSLCLFYFLTIRDGHNFGGDFSMYIHHAKNIVDGTKYQDTGYIYNPSYPSLSPKSYPPIFPVLLAPIYYFFGLNLNAMKAELIIFFMLSLYVIFLNFKSKIPTIYLPLFIAIIGFNNYFWRFKDNVLSDIPFLLFTYFTLFSIAQGYKSYLEHRLKKIYPIIIGVLLYLSYGTRSIGIVLLPSIFIFELLRFKKLTKISVISSVIFLFLAVSCYVSI